MYHGHLYGHQIIYVTLLVSSWKNIYNGGSVWSIEFQVMRLAHNDNLSKCPTKNYFLKYCFSNEILNSVIIHTHVLGTFNSLLFLFFGYAPICDFTTCISYLIYHIYCLQKTFCILV